MKISYRFIEPEEFDLIGRFFDEEGVPRPDPRFTRALVAFDDGRPIGLICFQLVAHTEPIIVDPAYRGMKIASEMATLMDAFCMASQVAGVYAQPTSAASAHLLATLGFSQCEHPLFLKVYNYGGEEEEWPRQFQPLSDWAEA